MAFATYNAGNGNVTVVRNTLTANRDYLVTNNTECAWDCHLDHGAGDTDDLFFALAPGQTRVLHINAGTGSASNLICTPKHTAVNAAVEFPQEALTAGGNVTRDSGARVVWTDFTG